MSIPQILFAENANMAAHISCKYKSGQQTSQARSFTSAVIHRAPTNGERANSYLFLY